MNKNDRIFAFTALGAYILDYPNDLKNAVLSAKAANTWFTVENCELALNNIASAFLQDNKLKNWVAQYETPKNAKTIGVVAAGNIPLVAFHDVLCVLISGHRLKIKFSEKAKTLLPFLLKQLVEIQPAFQDKIEVVERLKDFDAVIATGSNNTARYFEYYFGKHPNIIRKNRNSVAVLDGKENETDLRNLAKDIFTYFGLGCRNVSKVYLPKEYDFRPLLAAFEDFKFLMDHYHYRNNLDYNRTLLLMNQVPMLDIDFVNINENEQLASPISNLHYAFYENVSEVESALAEQKENLQCIVGKQDFCSVDFGESQQPSLTQYADDVDVMAFLSGL